MQIELFVPIILALAQIPIGIMGVTMPQERSKIPPIISAIALICILALIALTWQGIVSQTVTLLGSIVVTVLSIIVAMVFILKHRLQESETSKSKENVLDGIKVDLITLNAHEKEASIQKARVPCTKELAIQIKNGFESNFGKNIIGVVVDTLRAIVEKRSVDPLIDFFKKFGDILDSNDYGLKQILNKDDYYKSALMELAKKRIKIKRAKKNIIQNNINRVRALSYGLNSSVLLRSVLLTIPKEKSTEVYSVVSTTLEGIESAMEKTLNTALNDLENEWEISDDAIKGLEKSLPMLALLEELGSMNDLRTKTND